jgi:hypothetical protein
MLSDVEVGPRKTCFVPAVNDTSAFAFDERFTVVRVSVLAAEYVPRPVSQSPVGLPEPSTAVMA